MNFEFYHFFKPIENILFLSKHPLLALVAQNPKKIISRSPAFLAMLFLEDSFFFGKDFL